jgi:hypothetical protein
MRFLVVVVFLVACASSGNPFGPHYDVADRLFVQVPPGSGYTMKECGNTRVAYFTGPSMPWVRYALLRDHQGKEIPNPKLVETRVPRDTYFDIKCFGDNRHAAFQIGNRGAHERRAFVLLQKAGKMEQQPGLFNQWGSTVDSSGYSQPISEDGGLVRLLDVEKRVLLPDSSDPTLQGFVKQEGHKTHAHSNAMVVFVGKHQQGDAVSWSVWDHQGRRFTPHLYSAVYSRSMTLLGSGDDKVEALIAQTADGKAAAFTPSAPDWGGYKLLVASVSLEQANAALERHFDKYNAEQIRMQEEYAAATAEHQQMLLQNIRTVLSSRQAGTREYWEELSFECARFNAEARPEICNQVAGGLTRVAEKEEAAAKEQELAEGAERLRQKARFKAPTGPTPGADYITEQMLRNGYKIIR